MADHAIVLWDPTVHDKPKVNAVEDAAEAKKIENRGPHKSLKEILKIPDRKQQAEVKVPVVIDPRLSKVLRPHQIEGVKVSDKRRGTDHAHSFCISVPLVCSKKARGGALWQTKWV